MVQICLEYGFCEDAIVGLATFGYSVVSSYDQISRCIDIEAYLTFLLCAPKQFIFTDDIPLASQLEKLSESLIRESPNKHILRSRLWLELVTTLRFIKEPWHNVTGELTCLNLDLSVKAYPSTPSFTRFHSTNPRDM